MEQYEAGSYNHFKDTEKVLSQLTVRSINELAKQAFPDDQERGIRAITELYSYVNTRIERQEKMYPDLKAAVTDTWDTSKPYPDEPGFSE